MATIRKLPSGRWNAIIRTKGLPTQTKTFDSKALAEEWVITQGKQRTVQSIATLAEMYLSEVMIIGGKKRGGYRTTKSLLITLSNYFNMEVMCISVKDIDRYRDYRLKICKQGTVRLELQLLQRFISWYEYRHNQNSEKTKKLFERIRVPKPSPARTKVLSPEEFQSILHVVKPMMKDIFIIGYETAMRRSEILKLKPKMVDFKRNVIVLSEDDTKTNTKRDVPLSTRAIEVLKRICLLRKDNELLFTCKPNSVTQAFSRAVRKLCLSNDLCFHSLRHTCITKYSKRNLSMIQLQCISGHKTIQMLSRYCHIDSEDVSKLMD